MSRNTATLYSFALAAGVSSLAFFLACSGGGSRSGFSTPTPLSTGTANVILTDAPSDAWSTIEVQVTKVTLIHQEDHSKEEIAFSGAAIINLVDLDSIGELLASAQIPVGNYDLIKVSINTDPTTISLIPEGSSTPVDSSKITVVGNGVIPVTLDPVLVVTGGGSNAVQIDFDLAHPLFINQTPSGDVVLNFQLKYRRNPGAGLHLIHLHRNVGSIISLDTTASTILMHTRHGRDLTLKTDGDTKFYDADTRPVTVGSFSGLAATDAVMVASRLQDDGSLYAVRVWYCTAIDAAKLPFDRWAPEGHVVSVDTGTNSMIVDNADGHPRLIGIDSDTTFTFHQDVTIGTGHTFLSNVRHGFKVSIDVKDPLAKPMHASAINIERAVDGGVINDLNNPSLPDPSTEITYGQTWLNNFRSYAYDSTFSWWYFAQPSNALTKISDFVATLVGAGTTRVEGVSDLTWNATTSAWDATTAILLPVILPEATVVQNYVASIGTLQISYTDPRDSSTVIKTIKLTPTAGGGQTLVLKIANQNGVITWVLDDASNWATDLTTTVKKLRVSVVLQSDGTLAAYSLIVLE